MTEPPGHARLVIRAGELLRRGLRGAGTRMLASAKGSLILAAFAAPSLLVPTLLFGTLPLLPVTLCLAAGFIASGYYVCGRTGLFFALLHAFALSAAVTVGTAVFAAGLVPRGGPPREILLGAAFLSSFMAASAGAAAAWTVVFFRKNW